MQNYLVENFGLLQLLPFIISEHGIELNLEKIDAIVKMGPPKKSEGRPKAHWVHGGSHSIHIPTRHKGPIPVQTPKEVRLLCLDS